MNERRRLALGTSILGALLVVVGVAGTILDSPSEGSAETVSAVATSSPEASTSTSGVVGSSTSQASTSTAAATTTATEPPQESFEDFAAAYADALVAGDLDFLFDRLHPTVVARFGEDACRSYVASDIALIRDYQLDGAVEGPVRQIVSTPTGDESVDVYQGPVSFEFRGQRFETTGSFAVVEGQVRWFTDCV